MRVVYSEELADLATSMARMCSLATDDMELATHALLQVDLVAAEKVLESSTEMSRLATENEERGFAPLALAGGRDGAQDVVRLVAGALEHRDAHQADQLADDRILRAQFVRADLREVS